MLGDPSVLVSSHRDDLLREAEHERLAASLAPHSSGVRRHLARVCHRLANWLDAPTRYASPVDSGSSDWCAA
jgi:hypothetical protein